MMSHDGFRDEKVLKIEYRRMPSGVWILNSKYGDPEIVELIGSTELCPFLIEPPSSPLHLERKLCDALTREGLKAGKIETDSILPNEILGRVRLYRMTIAVKLCPIHLNC